MKTLHFNNYDGGAVRAYFKDEKLLYCIQPANGGLGLLHCFCDGEPSRPVKNPNYYIFDGLGAKGISWAEFLACFIECKNLRDIIRRMDELFEG